ncbi:hypothetical protein AB0L62_08855 [Nocardia asteroides]|uniref:hypothetical protein n=1 Tax=Nocardia asteroides TaxID=1824 RepID=UPI003417F069
MFQKNTLRSAVLLTIVGAAMVTGAGMAGAEPAAPRSADSISGCDSHDWYYGTVNPFACVLAMLSSMSGTHSAEMSNSLSAN